MTTAPSSASPAAHTPSTGSPDSKGFQLLRPVKGEDRYFVVTTWSTEEDYQNWAERQGRRTPRRRP